MKRLAAAAIVLLAFAPVPSAAKQDTVSDFRLERHVPKNWDAFVEIDGVEVFVENFKKSPTRKLAEDALAKVKAQGGPDVMAEFEKTVGMSLPDVAALIKGQLAMGLQVQFMGPGQGVNVVVTADCRTAENAKTLYDLVAKRMEKAESADLGGVRGIVGADGVAMAADGPVVWVFNTNKIAAQFLQRRDKGAPRPLADEDSFKGARTTVSASRGGVFAWTNVGKFAPLMGLIPDEKAKELVEKSGLTGVKGYAASIRFEAGRVAQTHAVFVGEKATGLMADLTALKGAGMNVHEAPKGTALGIGFSKEFAGVVQKLAKMAIDANGGFHDENAEKAFEPLFREPKALTAGILKAGGGFAMVLEGTPLVEVVENVLDFTPLMGITIKETKEEGLTINELQLDEKQSQDFPFKAIGVSDERVFVGLEKEPVSAAHTMVKAGGEDRDDAESKALLEGVKSKGAAIVYFDFALSGEFVKAMTERFQPDAPAEIKAVIETLAAAGRSIEWIESRDGAVIFESRSTTGLSLAALPWMLPAAAPRAKDEPAHNAACEARLKIVLTALEAYRMDKGKYPTETGGALLDALVAGKYVEADAVKCPDHGRFRGPTADLNTLTADDVAAICDHGPREVVLRLNGIVETLTAADAGYEKARRATKP